MNFHGEFGILIILSHNWSLGMGATWEWLCGYATRAATQDPMLRSPPPTTTTWRWRWFSVLYMKPHGACPKGSHTVPHAAGSWPPAPCPSPLISTSFYPGMQQGQVDGGWKREGAHILLLPPIPSEVMGMEMRRVRDSAVTQNRAGHWLSPSQENSTMGLFSKQLCGASPTSIQVWSMFCHRDYNPLGLSICHGSWWLAWEDWLLWPLPLPPFLIFHWVPQMGEYISKMARSGPTPQTFELRGNNLLRKFPPSRILVPSPFLTMANKAVKIFALHVSALFSKAQLISPSNLVVWR